MFANIPLFRIVLEAKRTMYASKFNWFMFCFFFFNFAAHRVLFLLAQCLLPIVPADQRLATERCVMILSNLCNQFTYFGSGIGMLRIVIFGCVSVLRSACLRFRTFKM
ncbi:hypothetical protein BJ742DRAFT_811451 [Cladochytrium replicatum]|nr:hypothetical protein BJ742DRAFT_811451 [Cladochytrium replicatum]